MKKLLSLIFVLIILGTPIYAQTFSGENPKLCWSYSNDSVTGITLDDIAGNNDGILFGGLTTGEIGKIDQAFFYNGVDSFVNTTTNLGLGGIKSRSISAWINVNGTDLNRGIWNYGLYGITNAHFGSLYNTNPTLGIFVDVFPTGAITQFFPHNNSWYHYVATYDGVNIKQYINNTLMDATVFTISTTDTLFSTGVYDEGFNIFFKGLIDEVMVFNYSLSVGEINELYFNYTGVGCEFLFNITPPSPPNVTTNITTPQAIEAGLESVTNGIQFIGLLILLMFSVMLFILYPDKHLVVIFNVLLDFGLIHGFWIFGFQIFSYITLGITIYNFVILYTLNGKDDLQ